MFLILLNNKAKKIRIGENISINLKNSYYFPVFHFRRTDHGQQEKKKTKNPTFLRWTNYTITEQTEFTTKEKNQVRLFSSYRETKTRWIFVTTTSQKLSPAVLRKLQCDKYISIKERRIFPSFRYQPSRPTTKHTGDHERAGQALHLSRRTIALHRPN